MRSWPCGVLGVFLSACGGALADGRSQFEQGQYPDAKQTLASLEPEAARWDGARQATYALYRGLTFGALGDTARARSWLREAETLEAAHPESLSPEDRLRLKVVLEASAEP